MDWTQGRRQQRREQHQAHEMMERDAAGEGFMVFVGDVSEWAPTRKEAWQRGKQLAHAIGQHPDAIVVSPA